MAGLTERYAALVTSCPKRALLLLAAFVGLMAIPASTVRLDNNFSKLYATATEADAFRLYYRSVFGANDGLFIAVLTPELPESPRFIDLLSELSNESEADEAIARVYSATKTALPMDIDDTVEFTPVFGADSKLRASFAERIKRLHDSPLGTRLVSKNGTRFVLGAEVDGERTSFESIVGPEQRFRKRVHGAIERSGLAVNVLFGGIPHTRVHLTQALEGDLFYLAPFVTVVLAFLLWWRIRSATAVAVTLLSVLFANLGAAGVIGLFDDDLNFLTVIYPILLASITVAHAVHMLHQFGLEVQGQGTDVVHATQIACARVTKAALLTTLTTAVGFGSLLAARTTILRSFGFYLSAGVIISFLVVSIILPASFALLGRTMVRSANVTKPSKSSSRFERLVPALISPRGSKLVIAASLAIFFSLSFYARSVRFDYILSDHASEGSDLARANAIIDEELGGTVPIEISFLGKPGDMLSPAILARMAQCAEWLERNYGVPPPIGLTSVLREIHREFGGPNKVPDNRPLVSQLMLVAESSPDGIVQQLVTDDRSHARLRTSAPDGGANYIVSMHHAFDAYAARVFDNTGIDARMTGGMVIGYEGMKRLSRELVQSVLIALILVLFVIGVAFRSVRIAAASVLPNVLPVIGGLALLRATGSVINPVPGIVFCVGIGLSVDDTIHLISRYREEIPRNDTPRLAITSAVKHTKGALITTTLALAIGFLVLMWSGSDLNRTFAWLGASVVSIALATDLLVTPAVLALISSQHTISSPVVSDGGDIGGVSCDTHREI